MKTKSNYKNLSCDCWTASDWITANWPDVGCRIATAIKGVSATDAEGLTPEQQAAILEECRAMPLCNLPDSEFALGGDFDELARKAGYASGRAAANDLGLFNGTLGEALDVIRAPSVMKVSISDYRTGAEIWRGDVDRAVWEKYLAVADEVTGAAPSSIFLDQGLLTGQVVPATIFAEEI